MIDSRLEWPLYWPVQENVPDNQYRQALEWAAKYGPSESYRYTYFSTSRPLIGISGLENGWVGERFFFTNELLPVDRAVHLDLVPYTPNTWVAMAQQIYRQEYGEHPKAWCFATGDTMEMAGISFQPEGSGYQAEFFTHEGKSLQAWFPSIEEALMKAYTGGRRTPMPPDTLEQMVTCWEQIESA